MSCGYGLYESDTVSFEPSPERCCVVVGFAIADRLELAVAES